MKKPQLSVIVPVYNAERYLGACVDSLLAQTFTDFELILADNGSTDGSHELCARYAAENPGRIRLLTLPEPSVSAARNAGIEAAEGHFVTFMDADDWAEKDFLAEFFRGPLPDADTVVLQGILYDFSQAEHPKPSCPMFRYDDADFTIGDAPATAQTQRFLFDGCSACKLYATEMLRRNGIRFIETLCSREDHLFFFACMSHARRIVWRSGLYMHYMRRDSHTLSMRPMPAWKLLDAASRLETFIPQLLERFGITDRAYTLALQEDLVLATLVRAANNIRYDNRKAVLGALSAHRELFAATGYTPRYHPLLKRRLLDRVLQAGESTTLLYTRIALRRFSLRLRGHFHP